MHRMHQIHQIQRRSVNVLAVFAQSVRRQVQENKEFQKNVQLLGETSTKVMHSDAVKQASQAISTTSQATTKVLNAVGTAVDMTMQHPVVQQTSKVVVKTAQVVADTTQKIAEPIMETEAAKNVSKGIGHIKKEVIGSSANAYYAEYMPKEQRQKQRLEMQKQREIVRGANGLPIPNGPVEANDSATGLAVTEVSRSRWQRFIEDSEIGQRLFGYSRTIDQSSNPFMERLRGIKNMTRIDESETARIIRTFRSVDPSFSEHAFLKDATQFVVPELIEAYLTGDVSTLHQWCAERVQKLIQVYVRLNQEIESQQKQGLVSDCKLLDIRAVQISKMELVDDELPVILVAAQTHEILLFRNAKGGIAVGQEDNIVSANYVMAFSHRKLYDPEAEINPETDGWIVIDWARGQQ